MDPQKTKWRRRRRRHRHLRKRISGTAECPRLNVYRSLRHTYCQLIDDDEDKTLLSLSTASPDIRGGVDHGGNVEAARRVGKTLAEKAQEIGIQRAVLDRGGFRYHGRIEALANSAREAGLKI